MYEEKDLTPYKNTISDSIEYLINNNLDVGYYALKFLFFCYEVKEVDIIVKENIIYYSKIGEVNLDALKDKINEQIEPSKGIDLDNAISSFFNVIEKYSANIKKGVFFAGGTNELRDKINLYGDNICFINIENVGREVVMGILKQEALIEILGKNGWYYASDEIIKNIIITSEEKSVITAPEERTRYKILNTVFQYLNVPTIPITLFEITCINAIESLNNLKNNIVCLNDIIKYFDECIMITNWNERMLRVISPEGNVEEVNIK